MQFLATKSRREILGDTVHGCRPWQQTLKELTGGERWIPAVLEYFRAAAGLAEQQNAGQQCGWSSNAPAVAALHCTSANGTPAPAFSMSLATGRRKASAVQRDEMARPPWLRDVWRLLAQPTC
jgi:hypothetical protein